MHDEGAWPAGTTWFAVDQDGAIAAFDAGDAGAVPAEIAAVLDDGFDVEAKVYEVGMRTPAELPDDLDHEQREGQLAHADIYLYAHDFPLAGPYQRTGAPTEALTVERLPPDVVARMARFAGRFRDRDKVQPVEHWAVAAPGPAWLAVDEVTIRCLPGREAEYDDAVEALHAELGDEHFAELTVEPA